MDRLTREMAERTVQTGADEKAGPGNVFRPEDRDQPSEMKQQREREFAERLNNHYPV